MSISGCCCVATVALCAPFSDTHTRSPLPPTAHGARTQHSRSLGVGIGFYAFNEPLKQAAERQKRRLLAAQEEAEAAAAAAASGGGGGDDSASR